MYTFIYMYVYIYDLQDMGTVLPEERRSAERWKWSVRGLMGTEIDLTLVGEHAMQYVWFP